MTYAENVTITGSNNEAEGLSDFPALNINITGTYNEALQGVQNAKIIGNNNFLYYVSGITVCGNGYQVEEGHDTMQFTSSTIIDWGPIPASRIIGKCTCSFDGKTLSSGSSVTAYLASTVPYGSTCSSQSRVCGSTGTLSGSYAYPSCSVSPAGAGGGRGGGGK